MFQLLETPRLLLKLIDPGDAEFVVEILNSKGWLEFIGDRKVHSQEDALAYIQKIRSTENFYYWVARLREDNRPIGIVSFLKREYLDHFDIGFAFLPQFNGQGYALEGAKAVLSQVQTLPEHPVVLATTLPHNIPSIRLLQKLGLHFEREIRMETEVLLVYSSL